ncbi:MAG: nucleotide exchange factor GrpE [Candidatus Shapirobacteria bacterium]|jgi:molecular chaperone GrpE
MKPKQTTAVADTKLSVRLNDLEEKLKRTLADYDNLEKRIERERLLYITLTTTTLAAKFIEVLDDLYLANTHLNDPGLKMAIDKFNQSLKSVGVSQIEVSPGTEFDPQTMECLEAVEGDVNKIVSILKPGYLYNDRVIRPVSVSVGKNPSST